MESDRDLEAGLLPFFTVCPSLGRGGSPEIVRHLYLQSWLSHLQPT